MKNSESHVVIQEPVLFSGKGKTPIADALALAQMQEVVALAKIIATERASDQHPVANLELRAFDKGVAGRDFDEALKAAVAEGFIDLTPDCGPKQLGVFKIAVR
ncbi:TPA: hypothetical protein NHR53_006210 [Pseudomonas aeruginosa]|uniref:hypothetical protein n=1 Tax=Pseudomonas aeruginosa TaxID=287 RepID=UPI000803849D|nr:hypothetical protein [Pseudomonas aeruginosa]OBY20762.1 hypothetical protein A8O37_25565 [Pseudomonas aeruginosa]HCE7248308.1 hypothetical protein [Pseudomonas aeruginosa]HCE8129612.1 hypothetical protein [Pseudomonas aeruginosa]HCF0447748.1 hypothetical protein [Pseudomonas aeruginosa]